MQNSVIHAVFQYLVDCSNSWQKSTQYYWKIHNFWGQVKDECKEMDRVPELTTCKEA